MSIIYENWAMVVAMVAVVATAGYSVYVFIKKPTNAQLQCVKEWLLWAVTEAERELGSGTGQLKLRYVYNMFIERFGYLSRIITFDMVSLLVDEALDKMKDMLKNNEAVQNYVNGNAAEEA